MRAVNLISLCHVSQNEVLKANYLQHFAIKIKDDEIKDIHQLVAELQKKSGNHYIFDDYFVGFSIPQIGKEFDLLRVGETTIVNIEVKRQATEQKILEQLKKNQYYLSFLGKEIFKFTYISQENKLYRIQNEGLESCDFQTLIEVLSLQQPLKNCEIETLFNPSDYLVSPFNSTEKFLQDEYFLTQEQQQIKKEVLTIIQNHQNHSIAIQGGAGTGKTLLTYDIAKYLIRENKEVLILHCGHLNEGHYTLQRKYNWNIQPIKETFKIDFSSADLIILDECQRIKQSQLDHILGQGKMVIFSYDLKQSFRNDELSPYFDKIMQRENANIFKLNAKIRTNKEITSFIKCLFDRKRRPYFVNYPNITLNYFSEVGEAKKYVNHLNKEDWKIINYTPSHKHQLSYEDYNIEEVFDNSHKVIGQEFDNVLVLIGQDFIYKQDKLYFQGDFYYNPVQMLYQNMTRVRKKLNIVVINNIQVFTRCIEILRVNMYSK